MSADETVDDTEPSEYGLRQFPYVRERPPVDEERLKDHYGWARSYYKARPEEYRDLQEWLNKARYGISYDVYLARSAMLSAVSATFGIVLGLALTWVLVESGFVEGIRNPLSYDGDIMYYLADHRSLFAGAALVIAFTAIFGLGAWYFRYNYPRMVVGRRGRNIDVTQPHAIVFMYALSRGGMDLLEVLKVLSDHEETYGEIANECEMIVREVEFFGNDLYTALRNVRNLTPSDNFQQFLDDMLGVIDSGGDLAVFFEEESSKYLEEARDEQRSFLQTLAVMSEFFVTLFVAMPLFLIVILVVMSLLGAETLEQLTAIVYLLLPLSMLGFLVLLDTISEPYVQPRVTFEEPKGRIETGSALVAATISGFLAQFRDRVVAVVRQEKYDSAPREQYLQQRRWQAVKKQAKSPLSGIRRRPLWVLVVSVPLALVVAVTVTSADLATPTQSAMISDPITTTSWLIVLPLLIALVPLSYFHERRRARERHFARRFPDTLSVLASANKMGIRFVDALSLVARWSTGPMSKEMQTVRNDLRWNFDTARSLRGLANRVGVPQLSRTMTLIAEGLRSSSDVASVLSIAARDTTERFKLDRERRQELTPYIAVVIIGFLVFLLVVVLLDSAYLTPIEEAQQSAAEPTVDSGSLPLSLTNVPVEAYKTLFFHAALIQALGSGILAGKLAEDDSFSGLKYSIGLTVVAVAAFALI